jgi:hypothetical protein
MSTRAASMPRCAARLAFFLSSGLSFFITSWRAVSSFFFSSVDEVALIFVMKENVCAMTQPVRFGWRSLTATGLAAHLARRNIVVLPTHAVPLHHVGAQLAELRLQRACRCYVRQGHGSRANGAIGAMLTAEAAGLLVPPGPPAPFPAAFPAVFPGNAPANAKSASISSFSAERDCIAKVRLPTRARRAVAVGAGGRALDVVFSYVFA